MKNYVYLAALLFAACTAEKEAYTHTIVKGGGVSNGEINYITEATGVGVTGGLDLMEAATPLLTFNLVNKDITVKRVPAGNYSITLKNEAGTSIFTEIPEKFINMDAEILFSRKVFEPFFPAEWEPMKGSDFTTVYLKNKDDNEVFYMKVVATGTNKEMAKYSEDF